MSWYNSIYNTQLTILNTEINIFQTEVTNCKRAEYQRDFKNVKNVHIWEICNLITVLQDDVYFYGCILHPKCGRN